MIQKLTANSYTYEIQYAQKHYILLVTALNIGCDKCDVLFILYSNFINNSNKWPHY